MDERDERKQTSAEASKRIWTTSKPGSHRCFGKSMAETYLLAMRCPVCRRRDSHLGFRTELENLVGDAKGKGPSGRNREAESTDAPVRGGLLRSSVEAGVMLAERREQATHPNVLSAALANKLARIAWTVLAQERSYEARVTKAAA